MQVQGSVQGHSTRGLFAFTFHTWASHVARVRGPFALVR